MYPKPYFYTIKFKHLSTFVLLITCLFVSNCNSSSSKTTNKPEKPKKDTLLTKIIPKEKKDTVVYDYDTLQWIDLAHIDSTIQIDMKYATKDNFVEEKMYECSRCFLRPKVAKAVEEAHQYLKEQGYGLKMLDCYRPRPIQQKLWNKVPNPTYVTNPAKGSMHNRGLAVDLTLVDEQGKEYDMGTPFDYFGREAHTFYTNLPEDVLERRKLLRETMKKFGFKHISSEWWHYSYRGTQHDISDYLWNCD